MKKKDAKHTVQVTWTQTDEDQFKAMQERRQKSAAANIEKLNGLLEGFFYHSISIEEVNENLRYNAAAFIAALEPFTKELK